MMVKSSSEHPLGPIVRKLEIGLALPDQDREAVLSLPFVRRGVKSGHHIVWTGDRPVHAFLLMEGFAYRQKVVGDGSRQIIALHIGGDLVDLDHVLIGRAAHDVQMLTDGEVALIPVAALRRLAMDHPAVAMALWHATLVEGSITREWTANIGRRSAYVRIAHFLCEFGSRIEAAELGSRTLFMLPMSQEWLSDAVSLTSVHVNRVLKALQAEGLIRRDRRWIAIEDWSRLSKAADFDAAYLHLPPASANGAEDLLTILPPPRAMASGLG